MTTTKPKEGSEVEMNVCLQQNLEKTGFYPSANMYFRALIDMSKYKHIC